MLASKEMVAEHVSKLTIRLNTESKVSKIIYFISCLIFEIYSHGL